MRWITIKEYVDLETGEVLNNLGDDYYEINKTKNTKIKRDEKSNQPQSGIITYTIGCRKREYKQRRIW